MVLAVCLGTSFATHNKGKSIVGGCTVKSPDNFTQMTCIHLKKKALIITLENPVGVTNQPISCNKI